MRRTKIEWCSSTWNPVTGCYHDCQYCYARRIATRFAGFDPDENPDMFGFRRVGTLVELDGMQARRQKNGKVVPAIYPFGFTPTLHKYRLDEPQQWKKPKTIFVCSMADLFGEWIPDDWIQMVFDACDKAPQHRYLFLTKNPQRYYELGQKGELPRRDNFWYGTTAVSPDASVFFSILHNTFVSIEPIMESFGARASNLPELIDWAIIGAETGNSKEKVIPERSWVEGVVSAFQAAGKPVFMKDSLKPIWGKDIITQFPWDK